MHLLGFRQARINTTEAHGHRACFDEGGKQLVIYRAGKYLQHSIDNGRRGYTETADEFGFDSPFLQKTGHLFAAAVDHYDMDPTSMDLAISVESRWRESWLSRSVPPSFTRIFK